MKSSLRVLSAAALTGLVCLNFSGNSNEAKAQDILLKPTLDSESTFTLTEVSTQAEDTITKYEFNTVTQELKPVHFRFDLKSITYGDGENFESFSTELFGKSTTYTIKYGNSLEEINGTTVSADISADVINQYLPVFNPSNGVFGSIDGAFVRNYSKATQAPVRNLGTINSLSGVFAANSNICDIRMDDNAFGGALYNTGVTKNIDADFIMNKASMGTAYGGAIYNQGRIESLSGNFIGNYAEATGSNNNKSVYGGAIANVGDFGDITADFINNKAFNDQILKYNPASTDAFGGAIYNTASIQNIKGDFIGNSTVNIAENPSSYYGQYLYSHGGAIYNSGSIASITGNFIDNTAYARTNHAHGGAIYNSGTIGDINGSFINNSTNRPDYYGAGGAIFNEGTINSIVGEFISNEASAGSAIYNNGNIELINANFIRNKNSVLTNEGVITNLMGSFVENDNFAIENYNSIGSVNANFVNNSMGIINTEYSIIGSISGNFINNGKNSSSDYLTRGGAISNEGIIGASDDIQQQQYIQMDVIDSNGNFVASLFSTQDNLTQEQVENGNYNFELVDKFEVSISDVIDNNGNQIETIEQMIASGAQQGFEYLTINPVNYSSLPVGIKNSVFSGNVVQADDILIPLDYYDVEVIEYKDVFVNAETGESLVSYFIDADKATVDQYISDGYKIFAYEIESDPYEIPAEEWDAFIADFEAAKASGVASLESKLNEFIQSFPKDAFIPMKFENDALGGAIYNMSSNALVIDSSQFDNNFSTGRGGAIANIISSDSNLEVMQSKLYIKNSKFEENKANLQGGAIFDKIDIFADLAGGNSAPVPYSLRSYSGSGSTTQDRINVVGSHFDVVTSDFIKNEAEQGGAIAGVYNFTYATENIPSIPQPASFSLSNASNVDSTDFPDLYINIKDSSFVANKAAQGGALYFEKLQYEVFGGSNVPSPASYMQSLPSLEDLNNTKYNLTIKNSTFVDNIATESKAYTAKGGAIYTNMNTKIVADTGNTVFSNNKVVNDGVEQLNDIHVVTSKMATEPDYTPVTLNLETKNGGVISFDGSITGEVQNVTMIYNDWGELLYLSPETVLDATPAYNLLISGDSTGSIYFNNKVSSANILLASSNLYLGKDNVLNGNNLALHSGLLSMINNQAGVSALNSLTVTGDTNLLVDVDLANKTMDRFTASEYGSHSGNLNVTGMNLLSDAVDPTTKILFAEKGLKDNVTTTVSEVAYTPIYKYNVSYDKSGEEGYFVFTRGAGSAVQNGSSFNPAVLGGSTSANIGATGTMNATFNHAFQHSADFMNIPYLERISMRDRNKYALSITGDATDMGRFSPLYQPSDEGVSVWVKPYATFETVGLKNGPKVHNNTYGTLVGFDTEMQFLKHGWDRVITGYIGYNGASQRYSGVDSTQNGGLIGGTVTMYKGNFFNATTVSVGANVAQNQTMYGKDDLAMLLSGVGNKTGYNFEFKEGKLILQPSMLMSYTFVNTFDYTNAAGVRIDNKPLHALQLAPGVKVIGNLKNGWQPYASVSMVWNLMGESDATANGVKLPEMSIKPYVQYGVGVQKRIKDHFTAYGQAMIQNGGRNGISLTGGFRWALGHDKCKYEEQKVERVNDKSKTLSLGEGANSSKQIIKQMTPEQRAALGGRHHSTSRTAKSGSLRQY